MHRYILRRLILNIPVILAVTLAVFLSMRMIPGDILMSLLADTGRLPEQDMARMRQQLGIDRPIHEQYFTWMSGLARGDMGKSLWTQNPVRDELGKRLPVTAELAVLALVFALILAIPIGVISATRQDTWADYVGRLFAIGGLSMPDFWLATITVVFLAIWFKWMPPLGFVPLFEDPLKNLQQVIFPAVILGVRLSATTMRMTRSTMLEVLRQDYIRTAWSKGLRERMVIYRHALKNALIPVITIVGGQLSGLLGGTVIMEQVFVLNGVGRLTLDSIIKRDYTQVQGNILFMALVIVTMNLIVDITYAWLDPRIRYD